jgi:hypothetical protein
MDVKTEAAFIATPRPWRIARHVNKLAIYGESTKIARIYLTNPNGVEDAALIVHRVNHYEQLVEALMKIENVCDFDDPADAANEAVKIACEALLCAEGRGETTKT